MRLFQAIIFQSMWENSARKWIEREEKEKRFRNRWLSEQPNSSVYRAFFNVTTALPRCSATVCGALAFYYVYTVIVHVVFVLSLCREYIHSPGLAASGKKRLLFTSTSISITIKRVVHRIHRTHYNDSSASIWISNARTQLKPYLFERAQRERETRKRCGISCWNWDETRWKKCRQLQL